MQSSKYRYDLDGLRGIAISFVVIFHVFVGKVSGGVDVFLLLSGYFFLGGQLRYALNPKASLNPWWPIWRTIRRLVPALLFVLVSTMVLVEMFAPALRQRELGQEFVASLTYWQNWQLISSGQEYGAAGETISPLQHLWSMSVQGQFYLATILLCTLLAAYIKLRSRTRVVRDLRRIAGIPLLVTTVASLSYATIMQQQDQLVNYYSTFSRIWELTLGALLSLYADRMRVTTKRAGHFCTYLGLFMILSTGLIFDGAQEFPGVAALYPITGAILIICSGTAQWMASKVMQWLGRIAYSLYLWHWPVLIIGLSHFGRESVSLKFGTAVIVLSLVLAQFTYAFIEVPFQQQAKRPLQGEKRALVACKQLLTPKGWVQATSVLVITSLIVITPGFRTAWESEIEAVDNTYLNPELYPGAMVLAGVPAPNLPPEPDPYLLAETFPKIWGQGCMNAIGANDTELAYLEHTRGECDFGDTQSDKVMALIGSSHAEQWFAPLDTIAKDAGYRIVPLMRQGCPFYLADVDGEWDDGCTRFNETMLDYLLELDPDVVVTTSTRPLFNSGISYDVLPRGYQQGFELLAQVGIPVIGLRDNPWFFTPEGDPKYVSQCYFQTQDLYACGQPRANLYSEVDPAAYYFNSLSTTYDVPMLQVDTADWFCIDDFCPPVIGNVYVYRDGNHISGPYVESLTPLLEEQLRPFLDELSDASPRQPLRQRS